VAYSRAVRTYVFKIYLTEITEQCRIYTYAKFHPIPDFEVQCACVAFHGMTKYSDYQVLFLKITATFSAVVAAT
jgi:hypothetical protein